MCLCRSVCVCVCIREAAADRRALGDYGTGRGTITHRRPHRRPQTDSQAGLNADGSLIGICHQEPTKSIYLKGVGSGGEGWAGRGVASFSHSNKQTRTRTGRITKLQRALFSFFLIYDSSYSYHTGMDHLFSRFSPHNDVSKGKEASFLFPFQHRSSDFAN